MLGKHYSLGSTFESTGESLVKLANFDDLKSQGSDIASFLESFRPDPQYTYLHVIAMGAGEYYGCNVNADYFPEKELIAKHHTFVEQAKVFREHDNKPYSPSYGKVAFSWYNPTMHRVELILAIDKLKGEEFIRRQEAGEQLEVSMGCFPVGTLVTMADGSQKAIETVATGEFVRTHTGSIHKVETCMTYPYTGKLYTLKFDGLNRELTATEEHPILVISESKNFKWVEAKNIRIGMHVVANPICKEYSVAEVIDVSTLDVKDFSVYNLSVDTDDSFVAENVAVHNCKVPFDICSICGNETHKGTDYCTHIKYEKRKVYPDGKQAYMINVNPTFFDISIVRRRADRIAYVLNKVASADGPSLQDLNAQEFEDLGASSYFPEAPDPSKAVFDISEDELLKSAATIDNPDLTEKLAMVKRIKSQAVRVLNDNLFKALPILEKTEPDLPVHLLDRLASKFSLKDILRSFFLNAIPMKPHEFTRIIIVQNGIPLNKFNEVLQGVKTAKALDEVPDGYYQSEIGKLLDQFLVKRSSFLPAIMDRLEKCASVPTLNVPMAYYDLNPALSFGHVRRPAPYTDLTPEPSETIPVFKHPYAQTPVQMHPNQIAQELARPKLKEPRLSPAKTGALLGSLYLAYKTNSAVKSLIDDPKNLAILTLLASVVSEKLPKKLHGLAGDKMVSRIPVPVEKVAGVMGTVVAPFVGVHLLAGHYRNQYNHGKNLGAGERFVAENPDMLSLAAPLVVHYALKKKASVELPDNEILTIPEETLEKLAELTDNAADLAQAVIQGTILKGRRHSLLSSIGEQYIDTKLINKLTTSNKK